MVSENESSSAKARQPQPVPVLKASPQRLEDLAPVVEIGHDPLVTSQGIKLTVSQITTIADAAKVDVVLENLGIKLSKHDRERVTRTARSNFDEAHGDDELGVHFDVTSEVDRVLLRFELVAAICELLQERHDVDGGLLVGKVTCALNRHADDADDIGDAAYAQVCPEGLHEHSRRARLIDPATWVDLDDWADRDERERETLALVRLEFLKLLLADAEEEAGGPDGVREWVELHAASQPLNN